MRLSHLALSGTLALAACNTTQTTDFPKRISLDGKPLQLNTHYQLNPDCTTRGPVELRAVDAPRLGRIEARSGTDFTAYKSDNVRAHCNTKRSPVTHLFYIPNPGQKGRDVFSV